MPQANTNSSNAIQHALRRPWLGYLLAIVVTAVAVRYISGDWDRLRNMAFAASNWLPPLALIVVSNLLARAYLLGKLSREAATPIGWGECLCLMAASNMLSMLTLPATGIAYRAVYLSRRNSLPVAALVAGTSLFALTGLLAWSVLGMASLASLGLRSSESNRPALLFLLASLMAILGGGVTYRLLSHFAARTPSRVQRFAEQCSATIRSRRLMTSSVLAMASCAVVQAWGFHLAFRSFVLPLAPAGSTAIAAFHQVSGIVGITPGAVGVQEGSALLVATSLGIEMTTMLTVLALVRTARTGLSVLIGVPCWWCLGARGRVM
ncbi:MAG: lysylphosphatidylglycerol synthase domain-containing protein [Planctomycetaceae bacterium]